jgi:hypothetical protein
VGEDSADDLGVGNRGHKAHLASARVADQRVYLIDPLHELLPTRADLGGIGGLNDEGFLAVLTTPFASGGVGVLAICDRLMSVGIRHEGRQVGQEFSRLEQAKVRLVLGVRGFA